MECRACGACCIAISISSALPGMPNGKPAGVRCPHLSEQNQCVLFGKPERPTVCSRYPAMPDVCGLNYQDALRLLDNMECATCSIT